MGVESAFLAHLHDDEVFSYQSPSAPCPSLLKVPSGSEEGADGESLPQDSQVSPGVNQKITFSLASKCIALDSVAVQGFPLWLSGKESACNVGDAGDVDLIPGLGRSPGGGNGNPFEYSCLKNSMDRGAWWAIVQSGAKSQTRLSDRVHACTQLQKELSAF